MFYVYFTHASIDVQIGHIKILAVINRAVKNQVEQVSL